MMRRYPFAVSVSERAAAAGADAASITRPPSTPMTILSRIKRFAYALACSSFFSPIVLPQINCRRAGQAERHYSGKLSRHLRNRICRYRRASEMSEDRSISCCSQSPHNLVCNYRQCIHHEITKQPAVRMQDVLWPELDLLVENPGISCCQDYFQNTGAQSPHAAPDTPIAGRPKRPKIKMEFIIILQIREQR